MNMSTLKDRARARMTDAISDLQAKAGEHAPDAVRAFEPGYKILNATSDEAVVRVYDVIGRVGVDAQSLISDLDGVTAPRIRVEINSPGGDVFDGIAIYNALRNHPAHVTTRVDGLAASIASVIAQAGDTRLVQDFGQVMIHNAWGMTIGDQRDHAETVALLEQQDALLAEIYARHGHGDARHFRGMMNAETWLNAEAAVAEGLADEVASPPKKEAPQDATRRELRAEIAETVAAVEATVSAAERVVALRADAGKDLSNCNRESLDGLRDAVGRLDALLNPTDPTADPAEPTGPVVTDEWVALMERRFTTPLST
jgi:ATP-dependent protease ClpP protease subunit